MFKICVITKCKFSFFYKFNTTKHQILGFSQCLEKFKNESLLIKEKPWKDLMKKKTYVKNESFLKEEALNKIKDYSICHHCKYLFPNQYLVKCHYRSSLMGLPILNPLFVDPMTTSGNFISYWRK